MKMNPVVHFELPAEDRKRSAAFYTKVFGWKTQQMGPEMGNYVVVTTTEVDEKTMMPKKPGAINGGIYQKSEELSGCPSVVIAVDNINEHIKKIGKEGGKVLGKPMEIPGVGLWVSFIDTEGNRLSILQPLPMEKPKKK